MRLQDRIAVVTGAAAGLGLATTLRFAAEGAHVVMVDIDEDGLRRGEEAAADLPGSTESHRVDLTDLAELEALFAQVARDHDRLHVLFNNAGIICEPGVEVSPAGWEAAMNINLRAGFYAVAYALPLLRAAAPRASVIFTGSSSGVIGSQESPVYSTTKGGIILMAKSLAVKLGGDGIRVNALCPGPTMTEMTASLARRRGEQEDGWWAKMQATIPLGRYGQPEEIADAALFLASDESSFVHGHALLVDGGLTAQ